MNFSAASAIWKNRVKLTEAIPELRAVRATLEAAMGGPRDFIRQQWLQIASVVYDFKPDLILELGRGYGNSTCAMAVGMKMLRPGECRLISLCLSNSFAEVSRPYLDANLGDRTLLSRVEALNGDIAAFDFAPYIERSKRILVFWDAHGYELALDILARVYPLLKSKPHLTLVHDMADLKFLGDAYRRYDSTALWNSKGSAPAKYVLGDVGSQYDEGIALVDFLGRNRLSFRSAESSYFPELTHDQVEELTARFGQDFSQFGFWYYFSLNEAKERELTFPQRDAALVESAPPPSTTTLMPEKKTTSQTRSILRRLFGR
jgi:hypothetical protein